MADKRVRKGLVLMNVVDDEQYVSIRSRGDRFKSFTLESWHRCRKVQVVGGRSDTLP
jgi:hypothetical protein